jgi:hypothetical protein
MTFTELISLIDRGYTGSLVGAAATLPGGDAEGVPNGDHLAVAIVSGIYYDFDETKTDSEQLFAAQELIDHDKRALEAVSAKAHSIALIRLRVEMKNEEA